MSVFATNALQGIQRKTGMSTVNLEECRLIAGSKVTKWSLLSYLIQSSNSIITAVNPRTSKSQHLNRLGRLLASNFFFFFDRMDSHFFLSARHDHFFIGRKSWYDRSILQRPHTPHPLSSSSTHLRPNNIKKFLVTIENDTGSNKTWYGL